jgi:hypothetical protein
MKITAGLPAWLWLIVGMAAFNPAWGDDASKTAPEDLSKLSDEEILRSLRIDGAHPLSQKGRFTIVFSPIVKEDAFLLDTTTGRIWRQVKSSEGEWSVWAIFGASVPEYRAWEEMERIDTKQPAATVPAGPVIRLDKDGNPLPPKPGDVQEGYRFKGGDPAQQSNWERVQYQEGDTATNPRTGARLLYRGGQWVPLQ